MNSREKEVLQAQLNAEKEVLKQLEKQYKRALHDIEERVKLFDFDLNRLDNAMSEEGLDDAAKAVLQSQRRSRVYQKQYQEALRGQISGILDKLHGDEYATIQQYLDDSYVSGFVGTMYDIAGQGVPLIMPIDQAAAVRAVQLESKVSKGYYDALGVDIKDLKKSIKAEVSRGIATGMNYSDIARNINNVSKTGLSNAKRIARTEAHRIQQASTMDAQRAAKAKGADVVKMWDATLDGKTRTTHRQLDGQIREIDEDFEIGGMKAKAPGYFGRAAEDINCRCVSLTRARWALDHDELSLLQDRAAFFGVVKTKDFDDFKEKYLGAVERERTSLHRIGLQFFAVAPQKQAEMVAAFKQDLADGKINLRVRQQKQNEHIVGTKQRELRVKRDEAVGKKSTYFYEGTDVEALLRGLIGTGEIKYKNAKDMFPFEYIVLENPIGKAYNFGTGEWVDVKKIAIKYGVDGIHAYPVKDWKESK